MDTQSMDIVEQDELRQAVRVRYGQVAESEDCGCGPTCCTSSEPADAAITSIELGYSTEETSAVPDGANMGLGCGNPGAIAALKEGDVVLDLGSGGGFDCFLAARQVGESGRVIGVDMTPAMITKSRINSAKGDYTNVEFRLGEIENLPVADNTADVIISNCVINLSPDKPRVFSEAFRALKPGGRLAIADIVASAPLPDDVLKDITLYTGCMAGASLVADIEKMLAEAGFEHIRIAPKDESKSFIREWAPGTSVEKYLVSATIEGVKPG